MNQKIKIMISAILVMIAIAVNGQIKIGGKDGHVYVDLQSQQYYKRVRGNAQPFEYRRGSGVANIALSRNGLLNYRVRLFKQRKDTLRSNQNNNVFYDDQYRRY